MSRSCIVRRIVEAGHLRIGELSRRSGVSPELLRAWERRYGLLQPTRSPGGLRLYTPDDLARVRTMQEHLAAGLAAAEAAALATGTPASAGEAVHGAAAAREELAAALAAFDEGRAHEIMDTLLARLSIDALLGDVIVPFLHELGERWERGEASIAQEHFATALLRGRLLGLARGWGKGLGPRAVLACAPGEQHDLGLIVFGLALRARGWRIVYLGADTPLETVGEGARMCNPRFVVVSAIDAKAFRRHADELVALAREMRVCLGGAGAAKARVDADVVVLTGGPVDEAARLTQLMAPEWA
jgi:DNA-binding transcriptional MerR regulator